MSEMIERVAKAIQEKSKETDGLPLDVCVQYARAAIEAMHEPTKEMCLAPQQWFSKDDPFGLIHYKAMIDAALK